MVNWSWELLSPPEQVLARRLAVFSGGTTLAAAERVCADDLLPWAAVLPTLSGLVDKSILGAGREPGRPLPAVPDAGDRPSYGLERLADAGEDAAVRDAFAAYYLDLAETADPGLRAAVAALGLIAGRTTRALLSAGGSRAAPGAGTRLVLDAARAARRAASAGRGSRFEPREQRRDGRSARGLRDPGRDRGGRYRWAAVSW